MLYQNQPPQSLGVERRDADDLQIDARELLESLQEASGQEPLADVTFESVKVSGLSETELILVICLDLG
jgi:hypothetical protein